MTLNAGLAPQDPDTLEEDLRVLAEVRDQVARWREREISIGLRLAPLGAKHIGGRARSASGPRDTVPRTFVVHNRIVLPDGRVLAEIMGDAVERDALAY